MKVGFVTPFNVRSAIGQHARIVGEQLAKKGWTIDILRSEVTKEDFDPPLDTFLSVSWLVDAPASALNKEYDLLIYNIGDNYLFHGAALDRLPQCPGLLIAHDFFLHNLFSGWLTKDISPDRTHDRVISNLYGIDPTILKAKSGLLDLETIARLSPMVEWISQFSNGAIAHANFYADRLRMSCPGPVTVTPLAYQANHSVPPKKARMKTFRITTLGNANSNKRISSIIRAIGGSPDLRNVAEYFVVGEARPEDCERWNREAEAQGILRFVITGHVPSQEFAKYIAESDVLTCLRDPVLEGGSGSVVEGLLSGRPVIVSNHGCYAEIPDSCVYKVRPQYEAEDLTVALLEILHDERAAALKGTEGKNYATTAHSVEKYVDQLMLLADAAVAWAPVTSVCLRLGAELADMGVKSDDPILPRLTQQLSSIGWKSGRHPWVGHKA